MNLDSSIESSVESMNENVVEDSTDSGEISLGEKIRIRDDSHEFDLTFKSFKPNYVLTSDAGITNKYAYLSASLTNKSKKDRLVLYSVKLFDVSGEEISTCVARNGEDPKSEFFSDIKHGETKIVYFWCSIFSKYEDVVIKNAIYKHTVFQYNYDGDELEQEAIDLEYTLNLD